MVNRMHRNPRIQAIDLLLQEQIPHTVPSQDPYAEDVKGILRLTAVAEEINPGEYQFKLPFPRYISSPMAAIRCFYRIWVEAIVPGKIMI